MSAPPAVFHPRSVTDAVALLDDYDGAAKVVAGGTALTLMLGQGLVAPEALISLRRLPGLSDVARHDSGLRLGALVTHTEAAHHPMVRAVAPAVAEAFGLVGNAQVRAAATVGGVMAEADYASDPPAVLMALGATVIVAGPEGERRVPVEEFLLGFYQTALEPAEIVTGVEISPLADGSGSVYLKYTSRSHEDRPCVGVAAVTTFDTDGNCTDLRVAVGAASDIPVRYGDIEQAALAEAASGRGLTDAVAATVADAYAERIDPIEDVRGSVWYRREMVRVWVHRALRAAAAQKGTSS